MRPGIRGLKTLLLAACFAASPSWSAAETAAQEREKALDAYLRALRPPRPQRTEELKSVLAALKRNPRDESSKLRLHDLVASAYSMYQRQVAPLKEPLAASDHDRILKDAYGLLLRPLSGDLGADYFSEAVADYSNGKLLTAWDKFDFVNRLGTGPDWMKQEALHYQKQLIPAAMESKIAAKPKNLQRAYRNGWVALNKRNWSAALSAWRTYRSMIATPSREPGDLDEISALEEQVVGRSRLNGLQAPQLQEQLDKGLEAVQVSPEIALGMLKPLLYRQDQLGDEAATRTRAGLMWAHAQAQLELSLKQMRDSYQRKEMAKTVELITSILAKDPKNRDALNFLAMIDKRQASELARKPAARKAPASVAAKRIPRVATAPAPVPPPTTPAEQAQPAPARAVTLTEQVQAMAYYNRGIVAYSNGDLPQAAKEWEKALEYDPGHEKSQHALQRVRSELMSGGER